MRLPTATLESEKITRVIFSLRPSTPTDHREILSLMRELYEMGVWCFDLLSKNHLESFTELKRLTEDDMLVGFCHLDVKEGVSFLGKPLHWYESKMISTIRKNLSLPNSIKNSFPSPLSSEVFTQKEIDRITLDRQRLDKALSIFHPEKSPFLMVGERYGDWLLALGRIDLLAEIVTRVRERGFIPIYSGQWATFALPKAKSLDVAAYAIPINKEWSFFNLDQACDLVKRFEKPVISLNPLADGKLLKRSEEAFCFLFQELKIYLAMVEITSKEEAKTVLEAMEKIPSIIPPRKTSSPLRPLE